jgi:hypothetical protein
MPSYRVRVKGNVAKAAAAYESLHSDIEYVSMFLKSMSEGGMRAVMGVGSLFDQQGLWTAALVIYRRCFNPGPRKAYAEKVRIPDALLSTHRLLRNLRDELAHENRETLGQVSFVLNPDNFPRAAQRYVGIRPRAVPVAPEEFLQLTAFLHEQFKAREEAAQDRIVRAAEALDDDAIRRMAAEDRPLRVDDEAFAL